MPQRVLLDRPHRTAYFALLVGAVVGACRQGPGSLVPMNAATVSFDSARIWAASTVPHGHALYQFRWLFRNDRSSAGGIGRVRVAAPDTLRFDARGPLGSGRMAAVVVGEQALWASPEDAVSQLVPNYPLFWAMFGVARLPADAADLRKLDTAQQTIWLFTQHGDTVVYLVSHGSTRRFLAEVRRPAGLLGRVETTLSPGGRPVRARLTVPGVPARLDIEFVSIDSTAAFAPDTWRHPEP